MSTTPLAADSAQPVLHLDDTLLQKNKIDSPALQRALEQWNAARRSEESPESKE